MSPVKLSLSDLETRVASHSPKEHSRITAPRRAAVSALLDVREGEPHVLLMQRATHPGDRWSGHVSFPGGREEDHDRDLLATAVRETHEEVGVDLERSARLIGQLDSVRAVARGKVLPMSITPFVFVRTDDIEVVLSDEAETVFWFPLARALRGELDEPYEYRKGPLRWTLPSWQWQGHTVWGLTYEMLSSLLSLVSPSR
jgi:8-oxo-dGTP pyrophosphatase MutT (NUDIX family)